MPCAGDLGCVICMQEPAERFIFLSRCSDLFNLLLCPFAVPTLSSFQSQSSCLLSTKYPYKGLCACLNSRVIAVFTVYLAVSSNHLPFPVVILVFVLFAMLRKLSVAI